MTLLAYVMLRIAVYKVHMFKIGKSMISMALKRQKPLSLFMSMCIWVTLLERNQKQTWGG